MSIKLQLFKCQLYKVIYSTDTIQSGKFGKQTLLVKLE